MIGENLGMAILIIIFSILLVVWYFRERTTKSEKKSDTFISGLKAIIMGDRAKAIRILREVASADTNNFDAYLILGDLLREEGNPKIALKIHKNLSIRANIDDLQKARALKSVALDYWAFSDFENSANALKKAKTLVQDKWIDNLLIENYEKLGLWNEALELLTKYPGKDLEKSKILALYKVMAGNKVAETRDFHHARILFKEAIKLNPDCKSAYMRIGDAYYAENRTDDAVEWWTKFTDKFPKIAWVAFERLERAAYDQGDFGRMIAFYANFSIKNPDIPEVFIALAELYKRMGRIDDAIGVLQNLSTEQTIETEIKLLNLLLQRDSSDPNIKGLAERIEKRFDKRTIFECRKCGFESPDAVWHCPKCGAWESFGI